MSTNSARGSAAAKKEFHLEEAGGVSGKCNVYQCNHCTSKLAENSSAMIWHLCVCEAFGEANAELQMQFRVNCPNSVKTRSGKRAREHCSWINTSSEVNTDKDSSCARPIKARTEFDHVSDIISHETSQKVTAAIAFWVYKYDIAWKTVDTNEFRNILHLLQPAYDATIIQRKGTNTVNSDIVT